MSQAGITQMVECGPGKVLSGLAKRIERSLSALPSETPEDLAKALESV
jgi:[acyl-carrier-protein] S-malonyltransferase